MARTAYGNALGWMRSRVPGRTGRAAVAAGALRGFLLYALLLLALVGLASPARFGSQGSRAFGSGWPTGALAVIVVACTAWALSQRGTHAWLIRKVREPFQRPLEDDPAFAGAAHALGAARAPLKTRFAVGWIWLPATAALGALAACLSTAYFVIDAVLARFEVGWQQPVFAAANLLLGWVLLGVAAGRLAVWPLAVSVHREATTGYA